MVTGRVYYSQYVTMVKKGAKGGDPKPLILDLFEWAVMLIQDGKGMRYYTQSDWLVLQWDQILHWKELGYQGLDPNACPPQWAGIMGSLEGHRELPW
jgi:hypothetical protein